jgi:hypothetical protein
MNKLLIISALLLLSATVATALPVGPPLALGKSGEKCAAARGAAKHHRCAAAERCCGVGCCGVGHACNGAGDACVVKTWRQRVSDARRVSTIPRSAFE